MAITSMRAFLAGAVLMACAGIAIAGQGRGTGDDGTPAAIAARGADRGGKHGDGATSHRRFDDVEHWKSVFDDPARDEWQKPDELVGALGLQPGMNVADIGAGTGYLSRRLSAAVGEQGTVFVVEVEPNLVEHMRDRAEAEKTANVVPVLGSKDNPRLPASSIDVALFVDAYHHIDARRQYLAVLKRSLRPGARVAIVEWKAGKQPVGPQDEDHKLAREKVLEEMRAAGFEQVPTDDFLPHQYFLMFR
ncbi:MAG TPA: methyltransferase domain-containing protein [Candidatus Limnocylindrales bacterium]|nr:methyltransferase domain-containing protein [Candidatus Limnocylindrales bacterium]